MVSYNSICLPGLSKGAVSPSHGPQQDILNESPSGGYIHIIPLLFYVDFCDLQNAMYQDTWVQDYQEIVTVFEHQ